MHLARSRSKGGRAASALLSAGIWNLSSTFPPGARSPEDNPVARAAAVAAGTHWAGSAIPARQLIQVLVSTGIWDAELPDARTAGWELAYSRVLISAQEAAPGPGINEAMGSLIERSARRLAKLGVRIEVLRTRDGCAVLRTTTRDELVGKPQICELTKGFLEATPLIAGAREPGVVVETSCQHHGAPTCLYTLTWAQAHDAEAGAKAYLPGIDGTRRHPIPSQPQGNNTQQLPGEPESLGSSHPHGALSFVPEVKYHLSGESVAPTAMRPPAWPLQLPPTSVTRSMPSMDKPRSLTAGGAIGNYNAHSAIASPSSNTSSTADANAEPEHEVAASDRQSRPGVLGDEDDPNTSPIAPTDEASLHAEPAPLSTDASSTSLWQTQQAEKAEASAKTGSWPLARQEMSQEAPPLPPELNLAPKACTRRKTRHAPRNAWVVRRGWLMLLATVIAGAAGFWAGKHAKVTYSAQALLDVRSGATQLGPGNAAEADSLAITYAAVIPTDTALLNVVASQLGVPVDAVERNLTVVVERNTSVISVSYKAPTSQMALAGATVLAQTISGGLSPTAAIPPGSIVAVQMPKHVTHSGKLNRYGLPLGAVLGLVLGIILVIAAERADPRADKASDLARALSCPAAEVPGGISLVELSRILSPSSGSASEAQGATVIVPLNAKASRPAKDLASDLCDLGNAGADSMSSPTPTLSVSASFETDAGSWQAATGHGPTVLAVTRGERLKKVSTAAERLEIIGRAPVLALLLPRARKGN